MSLRALIYKPKSFLMPSSFGSYSPHGVKRHLSINALPTLDVTLCGSDEGCLIEHWVDAYNAAGNSKRKMVVGGNWKCNGDLKSLTELVGGINQSVAANPDFYDKVDVIVAPPMLHLAAVLTTIDPKVKVAAQNW